MDTFPTDALERLLSAWAAEMRLAPEKAAAVRANIVSRKEDHPFTSRWWHDFTQKVVIYALLPTRLTYG